MSALLHTPPNTIPRIDNIWAAVSSDATGEGVCAVILGGISFPLIAADVKHLEWITEQAEMLAAASGKTIKIIRLSERTELQTFEGRL